MSGRQRGVVAIIQARMGSTRLPGKVLLDIGGQTMLYRVVQRVRGAASVSTVVVAVPTGPREDPLVSECSRMGVEVFRGSETDVLDRYYRAAQAFRAEVVVRITSDCPLIDPGIIDQVTAAFLQSTPDYASNTLERTFPRGLDTEVISLQALERAWREAMEPYQRTHVTPYLYQNPARFRLLSVTSERDHSDYRWTVDTPEDLAFVRAVYSHLGAENLSWTNIIDFVARRPDLVELNRAIQQKALHEG